MFKLMDSETSLLEEAGRYFAEQLSVKFDNFGKLKTRVYGNPYAYPCLVVFYAFETPNGVTSLSTSVCYKGTAKSLVYHKTNRCTSHNWWLIRDLEEYIKKKSEITENYRIKPDIQRQPLLGPPSRFPLLLTYGSQYMYEHKRSALHFFVLEMQEAKKLVYYEKDRKKAVQTVMDSLTIDMSCPECGASAPNGAPNGVCNGCGWLWAGESVEVEVDGEESAHLDGIDYGAIARELMVQKKVEHEADHILTARRADKKRSRRYPVVAENSGPFIGGPNEGKLIVGGPPGDRYYRYTCPGCHKTTTKRNIMPYKCDVCRAPVRTHRVTEATPQMNRAEEDDIPF